MVFRENSLYGPVDPAAETGYDPHPPRKGFFTDTSVCIGCKACEVACKEWNEVPDDGFGMLGMSYDNTGNLNANTWRHVAFIEQPRRESTTTKAPPVDLGMPAMGSESTGATDTGVDKPDFRWLMSSDVCKHCTHAACLDVCPTGSLVPQRVRHRRRAGRHLQRLRLLRGGLPVRRHRAP